MYRRKIPVIKMHNKALRKPSIILGFAAGFILSLVILYPYLSSRLKIEVAPIAQTNNVTSPDLLTGYDWSHFAGAEQSSAGVHINPLGRTIVNQDGTGGQPNPPVNLAGPQLSVSGDFVITAGVSDFNNNGSLQLYGAPPIIYDEWRYESPSIKVSQINNDVVVEVWNGTSDAAVLHQVFKYNASLTKLTVTHLKRKIIITANGQQLGSISDNRIFSAGTIWFGADATLKTGGFTLKTLAAKPLSSGKVQVVNSPDLIQTNSSNSIVLRLLSAKQSHGINVGATVAINPLLTDSQYRDLAISQFNIWTPENELKPQFIHPQQDVYSFKEADLLVDTALKNGIAVHGHTLVFGEANPHWMQDAPLNQRKQIMVDHISTVVGHFKGRVSEWDVVNEPLSEDDNDYSNGNNGLRPHIWFQAMGASYIDTAFKTAHAADPSAKLYLNDYGLEEDGNRWDALISLVTSLKASGVPIDGIGFEAHVYDGSTDHIDPAVLKQHMEQLAQLGLASRISEIDVHGEDPTIQANEYNGVLQACLAVPTCTTFNTWGITDKYGSTTNYHEYPLNYGDDLLWDQNMQPKPAYVAIQNSLVAGASSQKQ